MFIFKEPAWTEYRVNQSGVNIVEITVQTEDDGQIDVAIDDITVEIGFCIDGEANDDVTTETDVTTGGANEINVQGKMLERAIIPWCKIAQC